MNILQDRRRELRSDKASGHDRRINTNDAIIKNIEDKERKDDITLPIQTYNRTR